MYENNYVRRESSLVALSTEFNSGLLNLILRASIIKSSFVVIELLE